MDNMSKHILVAEDNRVMAQLLAFSLARAGFVVTCTYDGATAAEAARQELFDLVITDYQMPHMSGEELCEAIRTDSMNCEVPIVLCSAKGLEIDSTRMNEVHSLAKVFHKPFSPGEVVAFACSLLEFTPVHG
ncbi:MAG: response regulator transcription factor [Pirellulales bacterium]|nr:response regulator transcription factor [Pirellulales bacterium]